MGFKRALSTAGCGALTGALLYTSAPLATADQIREDQWALEALNAESVWELSKGRGVTVAVIDDGVNANHIDLRGNILEGRDFMDGGSTTPDAGDDHGTAMAAIIAAHGHGANDGVIGLAPQAKILPIRAFGADGPGLAEPIRYAVDHGASVINVSLCFDSSDPRELEEVSDAVAYALKRDVLVVGGAGNEADKGGKCYPAASPGALGVGAVKNDGFIWEGSNSGDFVSLVAPGTSIVSAKGRGNGYRSGTGTSDAAAYTSAAAALLRAKFPQLTAGQIANRLVKTAALPEAEKGMALPDERYGYGIIQPLAALREDIPPGTKYGPLAVAGSPEERSAAPVIGMTDDEQKRADQKALLIWASIGMVGLVIVGLALFLFLRRSKRNKNREVNPIDYMQNAQRAMSQQSLGQQSASSQWNSYPQQSPSSPPGQWSQQQNPSPPPQQ